MEHITHKPFPPQIMAPWFNAIVEEKSWGAIAAVGFMAPVIEEIVFRSLLFGAIGKWLSPGWTIVATALLFALVHLQLVYFLPIFVVGLVLGWARHKSGGLVLPTALHCVTDLAALLIMMLHGARS